MVSQTLRCFSVTLFRFNAVQMISYTTPSRILWRRKKNKHIRLVVDWDGTITKQDTLYLVAEIGYNRNRNASLTPWKDLMQAYISDYTEHKERYRPSANDRKAAREETKWLASLKPVEIKSIERVQAACVFKGLTSLDVELAGRDAVQERKLQLRRGWMELLIRQKESAAVPAVSILSVNWSSTFIRSFLEAASSEISALSTQPYPTASIAIYANEVPLVQGGLFPYICTSTDKLNKLRELRGDVRSEVLIYVGDSATDFDSLIEADVGICTRDDPMGRSQQELKETLDRLGVETPRLSFETFDKSDTFVRDPARGERKRRHIVWWVENLDEISKFIGELDERV